MKSRLRASAVCEAEGQLLLVRLRDPVSGVEALYPPGGGVEPNEAPEETARRETLEETGVHVRVDPALVLVDRYPFTWAGVEYDVTTHYFAARSESPPGDLPTVIDADYNLGAVWLPTNEALEALGVHPAIAAAVMHVLRRSRLAEWSDSKNGMTSTSTKRPPRR
jgi:8-oxo-dGTP pyrophosphatase MutT (NUDIX family)